MPLDGATFWQPSGWTIRVGLDRERLAESRHWSEKKRRVFQKLVLDAAYVAIDAIQSGRLYKRRGQIWREGSWIKYFLRRDHNEKRTVLVTISHFHFLDPGLPPDGPNGRRSPLPLDLLTLHVSGSGLRYRIDRIEGITPLPRPPARNRIGSLFDQLVRGGGNSGYVHFRGRQTPNGRMGRVSIDLGGDKTPNYYLPKGLSGGGRFFLRTVSPPIGVPIATVPRTGLLSQLRQALSGIGLRSKAQHADGIVSRNGNSTDGPDQLAYSVVLRDASAWPSTVAQTRLQLQNRPIRP